MTDAVVRRSRKRTDQAIEAAERAGTIYPPPVTVARAHRAQARIVELRRQRRGKKALGAAADAMSGADGGFAAWVPETSAAEISIGSAAAPDPVPVNGQAAGLSNPAENDELEVDASLVMDLAGAVDHDPDDQGRD